MRELPNYLSLSGGNSIKNKVDEAFAMLKECCLCPHRCRVDRTKGQKGICQVGIEPIIYSFMPHLGEEPVISGYNGSGTIFFSLCNLKCVYCQNYRFSQLGEGSETTCDKLSDIMISLQEMNCHNINLVTPTHVIAPILKSLDLAIKKGLHIPIVYNSSGYELPDIIKLLDGVIDIYLVDMRYSSNEHSSRFSGAPEYQFYNRSSIKEMYKQIQYSEVTVDGIMTKGIIIRHLVLPNNISGTEETAKFIKEELSPDIYISLMSQYHPYYKSHNYKELSRRISSEEYQEAIGCLKEYGLNKGWIQESFGLERMAGVNIKKNIEDKH